ncbi:CD209 antigen-like protein D [Argopecten irradians]|uniref:CD209 antigen-like protein D n=1 Tax=Argopecten irradians TaxID=31199 RepID=UPI003724B75C
MDYSNSMKSAGILTLMLALQMTGIQGYRKLNSIWKENVTEVNLVYNDGVVFTEWMPSAIRCARACELHSIPCLDVTFTTTTNECRGYNGLSYDSASQSDTQMWRHACRLPGYTYDPTFRVCIRLYSTSQNWYESQTTCRNDGADLLILDTLEKVLATETGVHKHLFAASDEWWVGGYDYDAGTDNDFRWSDGSSIAIPSDIWFQQSEPSDDHERCINLFMYTGFFGLNDYGCSNTMYFVCQEMQ